MDECMNNYLNFLCFIAITFTTTHGFSAEFLRIYSEAKDSFEELAIKLEGQGIYGAVPITSKESFNWYLHNEIQEPKPNLIIITSGLHGAEGSTGSRLQRSLMKFLIEQKQPLNNTDILFLHILNPWGMKHGRRVSEENIDLNRSFHIESTRIENKGYAVFDPLINPIQPASSSYLERIGFWFKLLIRVAQHGKDQLRQAILQGQFEFPKGIFYGGTEKNPLQTALEKFLLPLMKKRKHVFLFDIHTGYGERGVLHLFAGDVAKTDRNNFQKYFQGHNIDWNDHKDFYKTSGDLVNWIKSIGDSGSQIIPITLEFGTSDSQTLIGSILSLETMVLENQLYHHNSTKPQHAQEIKFMFEELFAPSDTNWQKQVNEFGMIFLKDQLQTIDQL